MALVVVASSGMELVPIPTCAAVSGAIAGKDLSTAAKRHLRQHKRPEEVVFVVGGALFDQ